MKPYEALCNGIAAVVSTYFAVQISHRGSSMTLLHFTEAQTHGLVSCCKHSIIQYVHKLCCLEHIFIATLKSRFQQQEFFAARKIKVSVRITS